MTPSTDPDEQHYRIGSGAGATVPQILGRLKMPSHQDSGHYGQYTLSTFIHAIVYSLFFR
jgi:hypothetical protein